MYFLEYGLDEILPPMIDNTFKLNEMVGVVYCYVGEGSSSHLRVLRGIKERVKEVNKDVFYNILSKLFVYEYSEQGINGEILTFYQ